MNATKPKETVPLALLDPVLYGAAGAFSYLGPRGQVMLDKVGEAILDYCFKEGYLQRSDDFQQMMMNLMSFFQENGYLAGVEMEQEGAATTIKMRGWQFIGLMRRLRNQDCYLLSCPVCIAGNIVKRDFGVHDHPVSETFSADGTYTAKVLFAPTSAPPPSTEPPRLDDVNKVKSQVDPSTKIGVPVFEAVEYGLARGFDYLGAQAQLLLDTVGRGIIEFLREEYKVELPIEHAKSLREVASFYIRHGLADAIHVDVSPSEARISLRSYRYMPVLRRLIDEDLKLVSCPLTLASRAVLRNDGYVVGDMEWELDGRDTKLTLPLVSIRREFDEETIGSLMDSV